MSLFERLGRKVEALKREADTAREAELTHRCRDCEERLYSDPETCPECGGENVEAIEG